MRTIVTLLSLFAVWVCCHTAALAHPAQDQQPNIDFPGYAGGCYGIPPEWDFGEIRISTPLQDADTLAPMEWYIVGGTAKCPFYDDGRGMKPWYFEVSSLVLKFYDEYGYIPDQLTPEILDMVEGEHRKHPGYYDFFRNPLTDQWPSLNAGSHSPGNLLIVPLSDAAKQHFAQFLPECRRLWLEGVRRDHFTGEDTPVTPLYDGVLYVRAYGWQGVLHSSFIEAYVDLE